MDTRTGLVESKQNEGASKKKEKEHERKWFLKIKEC